MAEFVSIDIRGDKELARAFKRAEDAFTPQVLMPALEDGARIVEADARARVPVLTGKLKRSIQQEAMPEQLAVKIGSKLLYAKRIEYGFVGKDSLGRRFNQPAQPYLRPALNQNRESIVRTVRDAFLRQLRKAVR